MAQPWPQGRLCSHPAFIGEMSGKRTSRHFQRHIPTQSSAKTPRPRWKASPFGLSLCGQVPSLLAGVRSRAGEGCGHRGEHGWHSWDPCARGIQAPWLGSGQGSVGTACPGCASSPELPCLAFRITTSTRRQRCRQPWLCPSLRTEADPSPCPGSFWTLQEPSGAPLLPLFPLQFPPC